MHMQKSTLICKHISVCMYVYMCLYVWEGVGGDILLWYDGTNRLMHMYV